MMQKYSPDAEKIRLMFAKVAHRYDRANQVLSFGIHHLWRKKLVQLSGAQIGDKILDCATGTGDLAIAFKNAVGAQGEVVATDFCAEMLLTAPAKAKAAGLVIQFEQADVTQLPYSDSSFDIASISFGIRNVHDPLTGLTEMARVLKPGGRLMVLEFGQARLPLFSQVYNFYSKKILPKIGGLVTGEPEAYSYLQQSSAAFPCGDQFLNLLEQTGLLTDLHFEPLTGGIAYIYSATKK